MSWLVEYLFEMWAYFPSQKFNSILWEDSEANTAQFAKVVVNAYEVERRGDEYNCVGTLHSRLQYFRQSLQYDRN